MIKCLLRYATDPNVLSAHEENELPIDELKCCIEPPIALAALHKNTDMVKLLLQYGAGINLFHADRGSIPQLAEAQKFYFEFTIKRFILK